MSRQPLLSGVLCLLLAASSAAFAGDSMWGQVTSVQSAETVVLRDAYGGYEIRIAGVDVPPAFDDQARAFVANLVLNKNARMRLEYRDGSQLVARLYTDDPALGIRDVGLELMRAGLAVRDREQRINDKYGELAAAEEDARKNRRGVWARTE